MARSTARKRALNTLYEADEKGQDILSLLDERIAHPGAQTPLPDYAIDIVKGVAEHRRQIDMTLDDHSTGWKVRRMGVVDRNILRIAAWEILFNDEVPDKVARAGFHVTKSAHVDAPLVDELPLALECRFVSFDEESELLVGEIVNVSADERILNADGAIDPAKLRPITFDMANSVYLVLGEKVGNAFQDGKKLK